MRFLYGNALVLQINICFANLKVCPTSYFIVNGLFGIILLMDVKISVFIGGFHVSQT